MLIPLSWLKEYVPIKIPFPQLAAKLSAAGLTVETWQEKDGDIIFDPEVTPNRPDWMSIYGIAREIAAVTNSKLESAKADLQLPPKVKNPLEITIKPNYDIVTRTTSVIVRGVKVKSSPEWLQKRIRQIGLRPISNLVDITNYVLWLYGNALHVFDYDKIRGKQMLIEPSKGGEPFRSLDGIDYTLPPGAVTIKDVGRVIDLVPLKGGENTAVSSSTKTVLLHSIVCNPTLVRRVSQYLNLRSDSSAIAERGMDPSGTVRAVEKCLELILELAGGEIASDIIDHKPHDFLPWTVELSHEKLEGVLGIKVNPKKVVDIFERLELHTTYKPNKSDATYSVTIPTFRNDLHIEEDLIEEVGRLIGYDNFPKILPAGPLPTKPVAYAKNYDFEYEIKQILKGAGYSEIYTYSLISEDQLIKLGINPEKVLRVDNPISRDYEYLRPHLFGNMLESLKINLPNFQNIKLFELGKIYPGENLDKISERYQLASVLSGSKFFEAKGDIELILKNLGITAKFVVADHKLNPNLWLHPGRAATIMVEDERIGMIAEVHPSMLGKFGVKGRVTEWTLHYDLLESLANLAKKYHPIPKYPPIIEDISSITPDGILYEDIANAIKKSSPLVNAIELIDIHNDTKTLRLTYQSQSRSLSDKEVGEERDKIIKNLKKELRVQIKE